MIGTFSERVSAKTSGVEVKDHREHLQTQLGKRKQL
jgi:hypothetical protein